MSIFSNAALRTALHGIFTDYDRFTVMAELLMQNNLNTVLARYPNGTEDETAARVARMHNGGAWQRTLAQLTQNDSFNYVKRFLGEPGFRNEGFVRALRCVEDFGTRVDNVIRPGGATPSTNGVGVQAIEIAVLRLR